MRRVVGVLVPWCLALVLATGLGSAAAAGIPVFVSIPPQAYFVERLGGGRVAVEVLVEGARSPHHFEATPRQVARLAKARAYFAVGIPFEGRLLAKVKASRPDLLVVETQKGIPCRAVEGDEGHGGGEGGCDPHTWLSPRLVKIQARNIHEALVGLDPAGRRIYDANLAAFLAELDALDARLARTLAPLRGRRIYVYHGAFGHFADAYGLIQVPVERGEREAGPRRLARLVAEARRDKVRAIFVQPQYPRRGAEAVARAVGAEVVPLDPLARDYAANLERMAAAVERGLRP